MMPLALETPVTSVDCYSSWDRRLMDASQRLRGAALAPLLAALTRLGVGPNVLTVASLVVGVAACVLLAVRPSPLAALTLLAAHVLLDGLDGPLARYQGKADRKGSLADGLADQLVVAGTTIALMVAGRASVLAGSLYVLAYTLVVCFAYVRNALRVPYSWLVRPRFAVYAWIAVDVWLLPRTLDLVLWACVATLAVKVATGYLAIRRAI